MKSTAAVLVETGKPLVLADLEIPPLRPGQVLVEILASGICHTQILECRGYRGEDKFLPHCLGHEGVGIVRELSPGVQKVKVNDKTILSWMKGSGFEVSGTVYDWEGRSVNAGAITTFGRYSVISENRLTPIPADLSTNEMVLFGCAVPTGLGIVFNTAQAKPKQSFVVFGTGGIGLCVVMGAAIMGCHPIIAVDVNPDKLALAIQMGATHAVLSSGEATSRELLKICGGAVDIAVEATGNPSVMRQALDCVHPQGGTVVVAGNARHGSLLELDPRQFNMGKRLLGTWGGDNQPDRDFPRYLKLFTTGQLKIGPLVTQTYGLNHINQALDDLERGKVVRPIIDMTA